VRESRVRTQNIFIGKRRLGHTAVNFLELVGSIVFGLLFMCLVLLLAGRSEGSEGQTQSKDKGHSMLAEIYRQKLADKGILLKETESGIVAVRNDIEFGPFDDPLLPEKIDEMTAWHFMQIGNDVEKRLEELGKLEKKGIMLRETREGVVAVKNGREYGPFDDIHMPKRIGEMTDWDLQRIGMRVEMVDLNYNDRYVKWLSVGQPPDLADELARKGIDPKKPSGFRAGIGILK